MTRKIIGFGKFVVRNKPVRKVGLDTDNCLAWIENEKYLPNYKPKIAKRGDLLYINFKVFGELMGLLTETYVNDNERRSKIFSFLKRNGILKIKKTDVNNLKVQETFENLKKKFKGRDNDLIIISIYHTAGINCISTNNIKDFKEPCYYLNISLDDKPVVEIGSIKDVNIMLRQINRNRLFKRHKKRRRD